MSSDPFNSDDLDSLIEDVLRSEPMRPVPVNLYRDIRVKLHLATLARQERARFRTTLMISLSGLVFVTAFAALIARATDVLGLASGMMSGGLGMYDSAAATSAVDWNGLTALLMIVSIGFGVLSAMSFSDKDDHVRATLRRL